MSSKIKAIGAVMVLLLLPATGAAAETTNSTAAKMIRFNAISESKVTLKGEYRIREWHAEGTLLSGFLDVEPGFPVLSGASGRATELLAHGEVFVPVRNLKAVGQSQEEDTEQMTKMLHRTLRADENPRIYFWLSRLETSAPQSGEGPRTFTATGKLAVVGVTNQISFPITVTRLEHGVVQLSGKVAVKPSDFQITPEFTGLVSSANQDRVEITFDWRVKGAEAR
jgi:hypothetical protein